MNSIIKIVMIFISIICFTAIIPINTSRATEKLNEIIIDMGKSEAPSNSTGIKRLKNTVKKFLGAIRILAGLALIIMIAYTGFKIVVGDTPEGKNSVKKAMIPLVTGTLIVFFATTIASFVIKVFE